MKLGDILTGPETWCQHWYAIRTKTGVQYCLVGALLKQLGVDVEDCEKVFHALSQYRQQIKRLDRAICTADKMVTNDPTNWNDHPSRTWDQVRHVVEVYDQAEGRPL